MIPAAKLTLSPWYVGVAPFFVVAGDGRVMEVDDVGTAVDEFIRLSIPPCESRPSAGVMDSYGVIAAAYRYLNPLTNEQRGFDWYGTNEGLAVLLDHPLMPPLLRLDVEKVLA